MWCVLRIWPAAGDAAASVQFSSSSSPPEIHLASFLRVFGPHDVLLAALISIVLVFLSDCFLSLQSRLFDWNDSTRNQ